MPLSSEEKIFDSVTKDFVAEYVDTFSDDELKTWLSFGDKQDAVEFKKYLVDLEKYELITRINNLLI